VARTEVLGESQSGLPGVRFPKLGSSGQGIDPSWRTKLDESAFVTGYRKL
jgi:hypothetical protein